jgi:hypothetical protein
MGVALQESPPEAGGIRINGEVPGIEVLSHEALIHTFLDRLRDKKQAKVPDGHELAVRIPDEKRGIDESVAIKGLLLSRNPAEPGFLATYEKEDAVETEDHKARNVTVALSIGAAVVVAGSLYWRRKN